MKVLAKLSPIPVASRYAYATSRAAMDWGNVLQQRIGTSFGTTNGQELLRLFATLLTPVSLTGFVFAAWRLGADLRWTGDFIISNGPLSNWMVWVGIGAAVQACANTLKKIDQDDESAS